MTIQVRNIFANLVAPLGEEQMTTLWQSRAVNIQRIVSHSHQSPGGFWYDQAEDEWVIVLRGQATLEFHGGERIELKKGDFVIIPCHVKHRVQHTDTETIWLAVKVAALPLP